MLTNWVSAIRGAIARYVHTCAGLSLFPKKRPTRVCLLPLTPRPRHQSTPHQPSPPNQSPNPPPVGRLKQETVSPEPREPEFMHHNIGGRDFVLDARYTELKCVCPALPCLGLSFWGGWWSLYQPSHPSPDLILPPTTSSSPPPPQRMFTGSSGRGPTGWWSPRWTRRRGSGSPSRSAPTSSWTPWTRARSGARSASCRSSTTPTSSRWEPGHRHLCTHRTALRCTVLNSFLVLHHK